MTIGILVAMNADRVIGVNDTIPWHYPGDLERFMRITSGSTVIVGRKTWESVPEKYRPLADNILVSASYYNDLLDVRPTNVSSARSVKEALGVARVGFGAKDIWFIGGARIYAEAMQYADVIDVTWVPWPEKITTRKNTVREIAPGVHFGGVGVTPEFAALCTANDVAGFPEIDETVFVPGPIEPHPDDPALQVQRFVRRTEAAR
jgi:dihydrofolate reductase